jgi:hypothetical protein
MFWGVPTHRRPAVDCDGLRSWLFASNPKLNPFSSLLAEGSLDMSSLD